MQEQKKQARSVQEEMARERKFWKQNQLWALLLFGAVILWGLLGSSGVSVATGPEALTLTMHDGTATAIAYDQITEVQLLEQPEYGKMTEGTDNKSGKSGTWESSDLGEYTLCVYASSDPAIRILTGEACYVVNLASDAETWQLYEILLDKIPASK